MNLATQIKDFFNESEFSSLADKIAVVRDDGTVLFSNSQDVMMASNIGALSSGVWQAAHQLISYIGDSPSGDFRLSFDSSCSGIYLTPIKLNKTSGFLCCLYKDEVNPGKLKRKVRQVVDLLNAYVEIEKKNLVEYGNNDKYLFDNITDEEMDSLFGMA